MARPSSVKQLPPEIRDVIHGLRDAGRTIDEILEKLRELEVDVSRSALGRYTKEIDAVAGEIRQSRIIAEAVVKEFGQDTDGRTARANIELAHALVQRMMAKQVGPEAEQLDAKEMMFLGSTIANLERALKTNQDAILQIRREMAKQAAAAAETVGKAQGLTADTIDAIKRQILGVGQ